MSTRASHPEASPLSLLTELAVEATSSVVETQRTVLDLVKQEKDILFNGVKERIGFAPAAAVTELVRSGIDTGIGLQQQLLTETSKQTLGWLQSEKGRKGDRTARAIQLAHDAVETCTRAQKEFLDVVAEESRKAMDYKHQTKPAKKTEIARLAGEAANAFIEAQKKLLDVFGQQMNVNFDVAARSLEMTSLTRLLPLTSITGESLKTFLDGQTSLLGSLVPHKKASVHAPKPRRRAKRQIRVPA